MHDTPQQKRKQRTRSGTETDRQTVAIPVIPPREPEASRITNHFKNRLRQRVPETYRPTLPETLIRDGRIRRLEIDNVEIGSYGAVIAFTTTGPKLRPWTLIAGLQPAAFSDDDAEHRVITIYQGTPEGDDDD